MKIKIGVATKEVNNCVILIDMDPHIIKKQSTIKH